MPRNFDQSVVRRPAKRRLLERSKPRPDRSPMVSTLLRHTLMLSSERQSCRDRTVLVPSRHLHTSTMKGLFQHRSRFQPNGDCTPTCSLPFRFIAAKDEVNTRRTA